MVVIDCGEHFLWVSPDLLEIWSGKYIVKKVDLASVLFAVNYKIRLGKGSAVSLPGPISGREESLASTTCWER